MKQDVLALAALARKPARRILGLMSGTSLDGLDLAFCQISGSGQRTRAKVLAFETVPYDEPFRQRIRRVFAQKTIDFQELVLLNVAVAEEHARLVLACLEKWEIPPADVDLLASHGQTVFHAPRSLHGLPDQPNATLQIGDGDHLARRTGIPTVSDFRQKHCAAGGEGAPLALYGDYFLFSKKGQNRALLNLGGIANFTKLPSNGDPSEIFATDTGPANTLLDAAARKFFQMPFDAGGQLAAAGLVNSVLLEILLAEPFFKKPLPKSTGPELFSWAWLETALAQLLPMRRDQFNPLDLMATLTELTARTAADALASAFLPGERFSVYVSGGGAHNALLVKRLSQNLPQAKFYPMEKLGISADAKEAVLFAVLANELVAGTAAPGARLGGLPMISMGKISLVG